MMKKSEKHTPARIHTQVPSQRITKQRGHQFHDNRAIQPSQAALISAMQRMKSAPLSQEDTAQFVSEEEELEALSQQKAKSVTAQLETKNTTGLPDKLKSGMENISGMSLDAVNVHYNSPKPAAVQAHAYAQGTDIHLASGQEQHLPHELGHVVQQAQGRVQATTSVGGMQVNDNPSLESEATALGDKALRS